MVGERHHDKCEKKELRCPERLLSLVRRSPAPDPGPELPLAATGTAALAALTRQTQKQLLFREMHKHAASLEEQGRYVEAQAVFAKLQATCSEELGEQHPDTLTCCSGVARCMLGQGRYREAHVLFDKAAQLYREVLGERHPDTLVAVHDVALSLRLQGRWEEARPLFSRALQLSREVFGEGHPSTICSINNYAGCIQGQGRNDAARPLQVGKGSRDHQAGVS